ncbi:IPTL-CTERM sorting domain-containing protein [Acidovorax sp. sif1233]|uniref:IPTL-CTERM sorting domain-containing protein n=1 Tax=unclassified Acidovorax TaxID=2684926 RepID=UPI001C467FFE|nr:MULTISPECIES: IPTL-CTERM sorting domain-containing protein [unclassified Acidovorax]MBV7426883.1 IPTL-CTERM sorting domain-containing protein [Acidovorax sp. sif0732]MBV7448008.1 IPTL-CTERM sorting domain-containing protein [Acidovorax sp. sif0715]MBV7455045.1 IPTL-CTERM sorting domain-containing protein [Acidovorax sp. sif1233]
MKAIQSAAVALLLLLSGNTFAAYAVYVFESGGNVVASGSGRMNMAALTPAGNGPLFSVVIPSAALIFTGTAGTVEAYMGVSGPPMLGAGGPVLADTSSGDMVGLDGMMAPGFVFAPLGYVSGSALASSATWTGTSLASLGLTPGSYTWTWGAGPTADSFTVHVGIAPPAAPASIPTLSEWGLAILSALMAGWAMRHRLPRRRNKAA